jgi:hypothetical protein
MTDEIRCFHDDAEEPLQPTSAATSAGRPSKNAATLALLQLADRHNATQSCIQELFAILHREILAEGNTLPATLKQAMAAVNINFTFDFETVHMCPNGCRIFYDQVSLKCHDCGHPRYHQDSDQEDANRRAFAVFRYWPVRVILQRVFLIPHLVALLKEHSLYEASTDGVLRKLWGMSFIDRHLQYVW